METTKTLKTFLLVWAFAAGLTLTAASSSFQDERNYYPPYKNAGSPPPTVTYQNPPPAPVNNPPPVISYQYPPPAQPNNPPSGGGITPPVPASHGHHHHHHHHHDQKPPTANCGTPPSTPTKPPAVVTPPSPTVTPPPATKPPVVVTPPTPTGDHSPSPPKGGCTCGSTPPSSTPPPVVVAPSPAKTIPHTTLPPSAAPSPTPSASPPSTTKTTTPKAPSTTPDVITNSQPPPLFPDIPFLGGTCLFWRIKLQILSDIFGWWSTIIGRLLGIGGIPGLGSSMDFQEALWNTGTDGIGALYREGTAALLNSMVNINFPFTTSHVRESFVAALASEKVATAQAEVFRLANEGYLKPRI